MYSDTELVQRVKEIKNKYMDGGVLNAIDSAFLIKVALSHPVVQLHDFHSKYEHTINVLPNEKVSEQDHELRYKLLVEEHEEFVSAHDTNDFVEMYDALLDIIYVSYGTMLTYGMPAFEGHNEVHASNMSKSTKKNEFGKTIKGKDYFRPNLPSILNGVK